MKSNNYSLFILFLFIHVLPTSSKGQNSSDLTRLMELGFNFNITENVLYKANLSHDFKLIKTSLTPKDSILTKANYSSTREIGKRWGLVSVNGSSPSNEKNQEFNREFNSTIPKKKDKAIKESVKIVKEDERYFFIEYSFDENSLSVEDYFLAHSIVQLKVEKRNNMLLSASIKSTKPVIVDMLNVDRYMVDINYVYNEDLNKIFVDDITYTFTINIFGKEGKWSDFLDYYHFQIPE